MSATHSTRENVWAVRKHTRMARTAAQVRAGQANRIARPGVRRAAPKPAGTGKRHQKRKTPAKRKPAKRKCASPVCRRGTTNVGTAYTWCDCPKPKPKARARRPLVARTNMLVPGITAPIYGRGTTVRQGAAAQRGIRLRAAGGGAQPRSFVQLPPRARRVPARFRQ